MAKKLIKIVKIRDNYWWINTTDNEPPSGGKEFASISETVKDINLRVKDYKILEEYTPEREPIDEYGENIKY